MTPNDTNQFAWEKAKALFPQAFEQKEELTTDCFCQGDLICGPHADRSYSLGFKEGVEAAMEVVRKERFGLGNGYTQMRILTRLSSLLEGKK